MKRKILTAAVGAVVLASAANANQLLFPYFRQAEGVYTLISLVNTHASDYGSKWDNFKTGAVNVHVAYNYKTREDYVNDSCTHKDSSASMSTNDMAYFDVTNKLSLPEAFKDQTAISGAYLNGVTEATGYAIISTLDSNNHTLYGQGIVLNTTNSLAYAYTALSAPLASGDSGKFASSGASWLNSNSVIASWYPSDNDTLKMTTQWYILPVSDNMLGQGSPNSTTVKVKAKGGIFYDHDEVAKSVGTSVNITCLGVFTVENFADVANAKNGGWAQVQVVDPTDETKAVPSIVYKMESTALMGKNFIWGAEENRMGK